MKVEISSSPLTHFDVMIPPSKSMAHRALVCAALSRGKSCIHHVDYSQDILTTIEGMRCLGAKITIVGSDVEVEGISDFSNLNCSTIQCNESGSTLRFFIPIFSLCEVPVRFIGKNRLLKRPQQVYEALFLQQGLVYQQSEDEIMIHGALHGGEFVLPGDVSSQFISGLLFTLPLCKEDSILKILPPFESRSYVDLTIQMLHDFQIEVEWLDEGTLKIKGSQSYQACETTVESDYSQLAFFAGLGCLNHTLTCHGLRADSLQGDRQILSIVNQMKGHFTQQGKSITFEKSNLSGCTIDMNNCPDLGPILMVMASYAQGETHFINAGRLRIKESDRIAAMEEELRKVQVDIRSTYDEVWIIGKGWQGEQTVGLSGHKDHRIVMALAIGATLANFKVQIDEASSIEKSYPGFFDDCRKLGIQVKEIIQ